MDSRCHRTGIAAVVAAVALVLAGCGRGGQEAPREGKAAEAREVVEVAFIFSYPMIENYRTMYRQAIDTESPDFKGPFNRFTHMTRLLDADFTAIVAPNNDTYYSFLWLDLRREPVVITVPPVPDGRYHVLQFIDMFTHNFAYLGTRTTGNGGVTCLVAGPEWRGEAPGGIDRVFRSESQFNYVLGRILVNGPADHEAVMAILEQYRVQPLSEYLGEAPPPPPPAVDFPPFDEEKAQSLGFVDYFDFLLQFVAVHPDDRKYLERFARWSIGTGGDFDPASWPEEIRRAMEEGVAAGRRAIEEKMKTLGTVVNGWSFVGTAFGSREVMQDRYLVRAAAARLGMYGNDKEEAANFSCAVDAEGKALDASGGRRYVIRFDRGGTPPVNAFWSITMYRLPEVLLVHNPIGRYSISDRTPGIRFGGDGSLEILVQHENPGGDRESNWLPAPDGPFILALRVYFPKPEVLNGEWAPPPVRRVEHEGGPARSPQSRKGITAFRSGG